MTNGEWIAIIGYLITLSGGVIIGVRELYVAKDAAKEAKETTNQLRDDISAINAKLAELPYIQRTVDKHDTRLIRLENRSFNL